MIPFPITSIPPPLNPYPGWPSEWPVHFAQHPLDSDGPFPLISVVIPSLNQGPFIEQTIRSILLQDYPNYEIIIIDAQSNDNTAQVVDYYKKWIKHFISEKDSGQSQAVNKGIKLAAGDWIVWQNSDDFFLPGCFKSFFSVLDDTRPFDAIYGRTKVLNENGVFIGDGGESEFALDRMLPWLNLHNQAMFLHKSIFEKGTFLDESFHFCMDLDFFVRLAKLGTRFSFVPEFWAIQRIHPASKGCASKRGVRNAFRILYDRMADDKSLPEVVRSKAIQSIICSAHANYADGYLQLFLQDIRCLLKYCPLHVALSTLFPKLFLSLLKRL